MTQQGTFDHKEDCLIEQYPSRSLDGSSQNNSPTIQDQEIVGEIVVCFGQKQQEANKNKKHTQKFTIELEGFLPDEKTTK